MDAAVGLLGAIVGALLGGGLTFLNTSRQKGADAAVAKWKVLLERRQAQLNELYSPLMMYRSTTRSLRKMLPSESDDDEWRLVHYVGDIRRAWDALQDEPSAEPDKSLGLSKEQIEVASLILENGDKACALLDEKAGLIEGRVPGGIHRYQEHHNRLRAAWDAEANQPADDGNTFPGEHVGQDKTEGTPFAEASAETDVDIAITEGMEKVRAAHEKLLEDGPKTGGLGFGAVAVVIGLAAGVALLWAILTGVGDTDQNILVTTPTGIYCGPINVGEDSLATVAGIPIPMGSEVEFVDSCG